MSSTNRGAARHPDDFYVTPAWCTSLILPHVLAPGAHVAVLDPACGDGAILDAARAHAPSCKTIGIEIDEGRATAARERGHAVTCADALMVPWPSASVAVINPPFSEALSFVQNAIASVPVAAVLLRLAFMAGQKRAAFHRAYPSDVYVLPRRPSFTGGGTDSADYAWFVFGPGRGGRWHVLESGGAGAGGGGRP